MGTPLSYDSQSAKNCAYPFVLTILESRMCSHRYDVIKTYGRLNLDISRVIVDESHQRSLPVVGNLPERKYDRTEDIFDLGFRMLAYAEESTHISIDNSLCA